MLDTLEDWIAPFIAQDPEPQAYDPSAWARFVLITQILERFRESPWRERVAARPTTLWAITAFTVRCLTTGETRLKAVDLIRESPASREVRVAIADKLMATDRENRGLPQVLVALLGDDAASRLRPLLAEGGRDPETFNWQAAWWLSYIGDLATVTELEALREPFARVHRNHEGQLRYLIWRIEVQNPPEDLLAFIASAEDRKTPADRAWAMRRAIELGLPKERIREAILAHAKVATVKEIRDPQTGKTTRVWSELSGMKAAALGLGILRKDDLPQVPTD